MNITLFCGENIQKYANFKYNQFTNQSLVIIPTQHTIIQVLVSLLKHQQVQLRLQLLRRRHPHIITPIQVHRALQRRQLQLQHQQLHQLPTSTMIL
jgi:uncharacterized protein (DUF952 family)